MDCNVTNANYQRVMTVMERIMAAEGVTFCRCRHCINAIAALSLNYLPPHYYVDQKQMREVGSPWLMVEAAVREAMKQVRALHGKCNK